MGFVTNNRTINVRDNITVYLDDGTTRGISREESVYMHEDTPVDGCYVDVLFDVTKSREDECLVSGWANVAVNADGSLPLDWQDDIIKPETLEKAAINFMLEYRGSGEMHKGAEQGTVVESIVLTKEKQAAMGIPEGTVPEGWFITVKINSQEVFDKVKSGQYKMFSIQGKAKRVKA